MSVIPTICKFYIQPNTWFKHLLIHQCPHSPFSFFLFLMFQSVQLAGVVCWFINVTSHIQHMLRHGYIAFANKCAPSVCEFSLPSFWLGCSQLPRSVPHRLHFTVSVLSLCLITRRSTLTVSLLGGERDWEIKFILNSFPLMWQLPYFPLPQLFSPLESAQHGACSKAHLVRVVYTESISFTPSWISNFTAEMAHRSFDLRWIRCVCTSERVCAEYELLRKIS